MMRRVQSPSKGCMCSSRPPGCPPPGKADCESSYPACNPLHLQTMHKGHALSTSDPSNAYFVKQVYNPDRHPRVPCICCLCPSDKLVRHQHVRSRAVNNSDVTWSPRPAAIMTRREGKLQSLCPQFWCHVWTGVDDRVVFVFSSQGMLK